MWVWVSAQKLSLWDIVYDTFTVFIYDVSAGISASGISNMPGLALKLDTDQKYNYWNT